MSQNSAQFLVVGIGASAGGINALQTFFANVPADSGCAYVVILHLSPEYDSQLPAILRTVTALPVTPVTERMPVAPDHIYVVAPNRYLTMDDGKVRVAPNLQPAERRTPIDIFFRTLADSHNGRGRCVILSSRQRCCVSSGNYGQRPNNTSIRPRSCGPQMKRSRPWAKGCTPRARSAT